MKESPSLALLTDVHRVLRAHGGSIDQAAEALWVTALPFLPSESLLFRTFRRVIEERFRVVCGSEKTWSPCLALLQQSQAARTLCFSGDRSKAATFADAHPFHLHGVCTSYILACAVLTVVHIVARLLCRTEREQYSLELQEPRQARRCEHRYLHY